jgi:hypothetical protein
MRLCPHIWFLSACSLGTNHLWFLTMATIATAMTVGFRISLTREVISTTT